MSLIGRIQSPEAPEETGSSGDNRWNRKMDEEIEGVQMNMINIEMNIINIEMNIIKIPEYIMGKTEFTRAARLPFFLPI